MKTILATTILLTFTISAHAGTKTTYKADPRAVEACQKQAGGDFSKVADCLQEADIAVRTIDAFSTLYSGDAMKLKDRCVALNPNNVAGTSACVVNAIKSAVELRESLPDGSNIGDLIFDAVSDGKKYAALTAANKKARDIAYRGEFNFKLTPYMPYRKGD